MTRLLLPLAQGIRIQRQAGVMPGQRRDLAADHLRLQYHGPVGGECRPLQKAIQAAVAVVAQCHVVRHREARLLRRHAQKRHGVCVHLHQGEEQLCPLLPRRPPVRQGQGGPVGAVGQALLRRAGLAGHQGAAQQGGAQHQEQGGPAGPLGGGVHQGAEPLFQPPGASGELAGQGGGPPHGHKGEQGRAVPPPPLPVPAGQHRGVAGDLHVPLRRPAEQPDQGVEPVEGAHPQQQGLAPQIPAAGVHGLMGQGKGPPLLLHPLGQEDAGPQQARQRRGGQQSAGVYRHPLIRPRRGAPPGRSPAEGGVPEQPPRQHSGRYGGPDGEGQLRRGEGQPPPHGLRGGLSRRERPGSQLHPLESPLLHPGSRHRRRGGGLQNHRGPGQAHVEGHRQPQGHQQPRPAPPLGPEAALPHRGQDQQQGGHRPHGEAHLKQAGQELTHRRPPLSESPPAPPDPSGRWPGCP